MPTAKLRNDAPTSRVRKDLPTMRATQAALLVEGIDIAIGTPIGLLLALTYAVLTSTPSSFKSDPPFVRIRNTD